MKSCRFLFNFMASFSRKNVYGGEIFLYYLICLLLSHIFHPRFPIYLYALLKSVQGLNTIRLVDHKNKPGYMQKKDQRLICVCLSWLLPDNSQYHSDSEEQVGGTLYLN